MSDRWTDLHIDGRRLDRIIRRLEKKLKKTEDDEKMVKYANSITYVTSKKIELVDMVLGVRAIVKSNEKKNGPSNYRDNYEIVNEKV